jgi:hypothetical protein
MYPTAGICLLKQILRRTHVSDKNTATGVPYPEPHHRTSIAQIFKFAKQTSAVYAILDFVTKS